ncbi:MAG: DEAD/DEAH box helicase [Chloroflexi bacterium]|nr:DEAD/DEAH box helicase [Chloroflexota bacterium]
MHLVLHLHWRPSVGASIEPEFLLWAETNNAPQPKRQRGRLAATPRPKPHPFAASEMRALRTLLQRFDPRIITQGEETLTLMLPSTRTGPLPSPNLAHSWELDRESPRLAPWRIPTLRLPLESGAQLLGSLYACDCPEQVVLGSDIRYWRRVIDFILEILAKQQYIPSIQVWGEKAKVYRAVWEPVWEGKFKESLDALATAMPPICRSESAERIEALSPRELLREFIHHVSDYIIRYWAANAPHHLGYLHNRSPVVSWLQTLVKTNPTIPIDEIQGEELLQQIRSWHANLAPVGDTRFVVALRLLPPPKNGQNGRWHVPERGWRLQYYLQARDDADVLVPAEVVWRTQGDSLVFKNRRFDKPQEKLLKGLGRAARLFPPIERSLTRPAPTEVELTTTEVYQFLTDASPLLKQSGFSLILPSWWEAAGARLGLRLYLTPVQPHPPDLIRDPRSADRPVVYRWELVLGETLLTREAFADLVALRSPLVQKEGAWLRLDPEQIEAAGRFWERQRFEGRIDLQHALRMALGLDEHIDIAGLPVLKVITEGWLPEVIRCLSEGEDSLRHARQPEKLTGELRPYQRFGFAWLHAHRRLGLGACLADDMGLGKSVQAIATLLKEEEVLGELPRPTLLICPTSLLGNWRREFERFAPHLRLFTHHGPDRPRDAAFDAIFGQYDVVLTSYALARRDAELFQKYHWYGLILDEAQRIKNPQALTTKAVNRLNAEFRFTLTGTPVENRLSELWSLFNFLNRGYLGSETSFRKRFAAPIERQQNPLVMARLQRMVRPFLLRRVKSDPAVIQDLPERLEMKVYCTLTEEQAALYQKVVEEGLPRIADLRGRARRVHVFNLITRLKQILNHPLQYFHLTDDETLEREQLAGRSGKLDRLTEMLEEVIDVGDRALVFTQFAEAGRLITTHLQRQLETPVLYMHGSVPVRKRQEMVTCFQEDPHAPHIFVLTLGTGGLGLNLTAANHVFHFDRWWNPAVENQASDRAYRIGQTRNVQVHKFLTAGTLEESIDEMIERKQGLAEAITGTDESWLVNLSDDELANLLTLDEQRI